MLKQLEAAYSLAFKDTLQPDSYVDWYNLAPQASPSPQYHAQDDFGQCSFGFASPYQTKSELTTADGIVKGAYSYVDSNGVIQSVNYIADALGFRVAAANLPVQVAENVHTQAAESAPI